MDDDGVRREIVEQRGGPLEEQRQIELDARGSEPFAHSAIQARASGFTLEASAEAAPELTYRVCVQGHLASGQQSDLLQSLERALRFGIELADGLDLVVEQIDAQRGRGSHGKDIEQRAANGELARTSDLAHARVAGLHEPIPEGLQRQGLPHRQLEGSCLDVVAGGQALQQRLRGDDQTSVPRAR